jgi:hypothetical protein
MGKICILIFHALPKNIADSVQKQLFRIKNVVKQTDKISFGSRESKFV